MAALSVNSEFIALTCNDLAVVYNFQSQEEKQLDLVSVREQKSKGESNVDGGIPVVCSSISESGEYFAFCSNKCLSLWKTKDWSLVSNRPTKKIASKIQFTPLKEDIVLADKAGDAYLYLSSDPMQPGSLILGHLSILLDILVTPDERYVITSDRDEKIRVSMFPNSYNIHCYCLGHEEFVSSLNFLPIKNNLLVSSSGDGTVRLWNYESGSELYKYDCMADVKERDICSEEDACAVIAVKLVSLAGSTTLLCVSIANFPGVLSYELSFDGDIFSCTLKQKISTSYEPWCLDTCGNELWLMLQDRLLVKYSWCSNQECFTLNECNELRNLIQKHSGSILKSVENVFNTVHVINQLYKRKFDFAQEYMERKKARLEAEGSKCKEV